MLHRSRIAVAISLFGLVCVWFAASISAVPATGRLEDVGLSSDRLKRIHSTIQRHIDEGNISEQSPWSPGTGGSRTWRHTATRTSRRRSRCRPMRSSGSCR